MAQRNSITAVQLQLVARGGALSLTLELRCAWSLQGAQCDRVGAGNLSAWTLRFVFVTQ